MKMLCNVLALAGLLGLPRSAHAVVSGNPVSMEVWAQINATLQISILSPTAYNFGTVAGSSVAVSTTTFDIQNTGSGLTETYQLSAANSPAWTLGAAPGANVFSLDAQFNGPAQPAGWTASQRLTTAYQTSDGVIFAGNQTGAGTATGSVRNLWVRFSAPTSSSSAVPQRMQLNVNAVTP